MQQTFRAEMFSTKHQERIYLLSITTDNYKTNKWLINSIINFSLFTDVYLICNLFINLFEIYMNTPFKSHY